MLLRGGSIFGLLCLNEKGTIITKGSSCLQGVLFFSYFPFISISSVSGASSLTLAHCLERRVQSSAALCCRAKWTNQNSCSLSFGDICCPQKLSQAMKMPLLPTVTVPSIRLSNQMQLIGLNSFLSICSRARESKFFCYYALQ